LQSGGNSWEGLKASDVDPRLVFHHGVPSGGSSFAYDAIQRILALSTKYAPLNYMHNDSNYGAIIVHIMNIYSHTCYFLIHCVEMSEFSCLKLILLTFSKRDGQIKLYGKDNAQAILESSEAQPSKFLQVMCITHANGTVPSYCCEKCPFL